MTERDDTSRTTNATRRAVVGAVGTIALVSRPAIGTATARFDAEDGERGRGEVFLYVAPELDAHAADLAEFTITDAELVVHRPDGEGVTVDPDGASERVEPVDDDSAPEASLLAAAELPAGTYESLALRTRYADGDEPTSGEESVSIGIDVPFDLEPDGTVEIVASAAALDRDDDVDDAVDDSGGGNVTFVMATEEIEACGFTCRDVTSTLGNVGAADATDVRVAVVVTVDDERIWEETESIGTLETGDGETRTRRVDVELNDALAVQRNDGRVTVETTIVSDELSATFAREERIL